MKTFETEKHNIPEGATHYCDETSSDYFAWFKGVESGDFAVMVTGANQWMHARKSHYIDLVKPIPQAKEVEWDGEGLPPVGVECWFNFESRMSEKCTVKYIGDKICVYDDEIGKEYSILLSSVEFSRLETEAERVERERDEVIHAMVDDFTEQELDCNYRDKVAKVCAALYDAGYRKESE